MQRRIRFFVIPIFLLLLVPAFAQDPSLLTVDSLFTYRTKSLGPVQWQGGGGGDLPPPPAPPKKSLRRHRSLRREHWHTHRESLGGKAHAHRCDRATIRRRVHFHSRRAKASNLHQLRTRLAQQHARRLLGARSLSQHVAQTRRFQRKTVNPDVREVFARRPTRRLRPREQHLRRRSFRRCEDHEAHDRRLALHRQRHLRLGLRRRALLPRRLSLES